MRRSLALLSLLLAPALHAATALRGGAFATVERPAVLPAYAEEWEAFLSLDGGHYYAFRITPHLDVARRQFTWVVPNVDTKNARILIRAGDEKRETLYELPATFAIVRDTRSVVVLHRSIVPMTHGEAARDGDPGVVAWTDGDRSGGALVERCASRTDTGLASKHDERVTSDAVAVPTGVGVLSCWFLVLRVPPAPSRKPSKNQELRTKNSDILLISTRLNI